MHNVVRSLKDDKFMTISQKQSLMILTFQYPRKLNFRNDHTLVLFKNPVMV
ncbi:hypothetical protein GCM10011510_16530 [Streptococcus himalayensis]|uniref:Uncharacterized protein n=1 Tax=Streptococcus himalayensis TaxID=1888195 RepID=A0A917A9M6_9STRE|nr:hypothetical protein GCM10011510_16530 [Streptococcus himalayensis]